MNGGTGTTALSTPTDLVAELTHRCPLGCPYCSNPLALERRENELDVATWARVFTEAVALGVRKVELSGGEPGARRDLPEIAACAREAGLATNLITSGVGITTRTIRDLWEAGLDHVQISIQHSDAVLSDHSAGHRGAFARKCALAAEVKRLGLPLTIDVVVHRANIERIGAMVDLALELKAGRIEIAHVQYCGWAVTNRAALMPTADHVRRAATEIEELRARHHGEIVIDAMVPDTHAHFPEPCVGGWGRRSLNVTPSGKVLPCHAAEVIPDLEFWNVRDRSLAEIWASSPAFKAFRGAEFRPQPVANNERRGSDFGGCRCEALRPIGDLRATNPAGHRSLDHTHVVELAAEQQDGPYDYRRM